MPFTSFANPVGTVPSQTTRLFLRWVVVVALLLVEVLVLSVRYDAGALAGLGWIADLAQFARSLPQIGLVIVALGFIVARQLPTDAIPTDTDRSLHTYAIVSIGHAVAFALLFWLTGRVLESGARTALELKPWLIPWGLSGVLVLASAMALAQPVRTWIPLLRAWSPTLGFLSLVSVGAWAFSRITPSLWSRLAGLTLRSVELILGLIYSDIVSNPEDATLGTSRFSVRIAATCSGYEGIGLVLVFVAAFLWIERRTLRFPLSFVLIPAAIVAIWLTNVLRIAALIVIGTSYSSEIALGGFHSQAGWLAFNAVGLGLAFLVKRSPVFARNGAMAPSASTSESVMCVEKPTSSAAAFLAPLLSIVLASMIGSSFSHGFDRYYGLRVFAALFTLWYFRRDCMKWVTNWTWSAAPFVIGVLTFGLWMALEPAVGPSATIDEGLAKLPTIGAWAWLGLRVLGSVVTVPIAEELAFRGYLPRRLVSADFESIPLDRFNLGTVVVSSAMFGLMHGRAVAGTLAGFCYAYALLRRGKLGDAIVAHATTNALIAFLAIAQGQTSLWT